MNDSKQAADRYTSFENIDCFQNAFNVIKEFFIVREKSKELNLYWEGFIKQIPQSYYDKQPNEDLLYLVCSNVYYLEELFEEQKHDRGLEILELCELECC